MPKLWHKQHTKSVVLSAKSERAKLRW